MCPVLCCLFPAQLPQLIRGTLFPFEVARAKQVLVERHSPAAYLTDSDFTNMQHPVL